MKVRKLVVMMFPLCALLTVGTTACEEKNDAEAEGKKDEAAAAAPAEAAKPIDAAKPLEMAKPAEPAAPKEPAAPPPAEVCGQLIGAVKAKDEAKVLALSTPSTVGALGAEGAKEAVMVALANVTCGAAKVEGDNAVVTVTGGEVVQDVPFAKVSDMWKFDAAGYLSKYPPKHKGKDIKEHHGKAAAKVHQLIKKHKK
ncbi:MAG: hypothetical protein EOO40_02480 [Deltaproteobacteria bacterium]|nr:MAG: hypothetical protein EOO40_02480 [Deltaproteobacteria bacterium]